MADIQMNEADHIAAEPVAAGPVAAGPVAADYHRVYRGRRAGVRVQEERFMRFLLKLSSPYYYWGNRPRRGGREGGRGRGRNADEESRLNLIPENMVTPASIAEYIKMVTNSTTPQGDMVKVNIPDIGVPQGSIAPSRDIPDN
ncbi:uncharacterized protein LOC114931250 [Nylanderia fulva]|uniref:uncharacterized protein LOC114931250 n=1 Tax=Nylanderia fulva TaxID=613905 RepID=UPI0010FADD47|nr:uncharacterized protein LOC114931250 [Nylanderia fulva]